MRPRAKLQVTLLHVEREPTHVDVAGALQDARGDVLAVAGCIHQDVGVEGGIKPLVRTGGRIRENTVCLQQVSTGLELQLHLSDISLLPF